MRERKVSKNGSEVGFPARYCRFFSGHVKRIGDDDCSDCKKKGFMSLAGGDSRAEFFSGTAMLILSEFQEEGTPRIHFVVSFTWETGLVFPSQPQEAAPGPAPTCQRDSLRHGDLLGSWRHCDKPWFVDDELVDSTNQELGKITIHPKLPSGHL